MEKRYGVGDWWREKKLSFIKGTTLYQAQFLDLCTHSNTYCTEQFIIMCKYPRFTTDEIQIH